MHEVSEADRYSLTQWLHATLDTAGHLVSPLLFHYVVLLSLLLLFPKEKLHAQLLR